MPAQASTHYHVNCGECLWAVEFDSEHDALKFASKHNTEHHPNTGRNRIYNLDSCFGYGFKDRYTTYIKSLPLGSSIEWTERLWCIHCGALVAMPIHHKNWHKQNAK